MGGRGVSLFDMHNHVIPGVDDGARDPDEAVAALWRLSEAGATAVLTTPHFDGSLTLDPARQAQRLAELDHGWARLLEAPDRPALELYRGVELMMDVPDPAADDERLRIAGGPFVLVEFPHMTVPPGATRPLEALRSKGWIPVLAHPERYRGAGSSQAEVLANARSWRRAGAHLQVNGPALLDRYGREARERAMALLQAGLVDYIGSDYHARGETMIHAYRAVVLEEGNEEAWALLTETNPRRLIHGETPLPVPPVRLRRSRTDRLLSGQSWLGRLLRY
jgi:protein-tyrosine phosphatase